MTYKGVARGRMIELNEALPYPEGQPVTVSVEAARERSCAGAPNAIRRTMHQPPHLGSTDVDELERAIAEGKMPLQHDGEFDGGNGK
jgi:hypothetical protein